MADIRQTPEYANYLKKIGWRVERWADINYFIKKIPFLGSIIKIQRPEEIRINKIREFVGKHRAFQLIVEPKNDLDAKFLASVGFKLSKSPYLPTKTLQLDLTVSIHRCLSNLKKDARYALRKFQMLNAKCQIENDIQNFRKAWKKAVGLKRYVPPLDHLVALKNSFKDKCLFLTTQDGSAEAIFLIGDKIAYYWQAFTNKKGRRALAQYKIVWEGIKWAKKKGAKVFDFEGIYDERFPNKSWQGFTHFKKSFGGYEVTYPGCFVKTGVLGLK